MLDGIFLSTMEIGIAIVAVSLVAAIFFSILVMLGVIE